MAPTAHLLAYKVRTPPKWSIFLQIHSVHLFYESHISKGCVTEGAKSQKGEGGDGINSRLRWWFSPAH